MKSPCKGCTERSVQPNCHSTCERYLAYRAWKDAQNAEKLQQVHADYVRLQGVEKCVRLGKRHGRRR